ncbi:hypothetical protein ACJBV6_10590, partial [Streptococcus suis]
HDNESLKLHLLQKIMKPPLLECTVKRHIENNITSKGCNKLVNLPLKQSPLQIPDNDGGQR